MSGLTDSFLFDFQDILNPYRVVFLKDFEKIFARAIERDYEIIFVDDPLEALAEYEALDLEPDVELFSPFEGAIKGLLPFQVRAYNYLKKLDAGLLLASTGVGKTNLAIALTLHHWHDVDHVIFLAKSHNKINIQRALDKFADLDSVIIEGSISKRKSLYEKVLADGKIIIANYEKLKLVPDRPYWKEIYERRCLVFMDEAPTRLKHRNTQLYRSMRYLIYGREFGEFRSPFIKQYVLTATPIEHSPQDLYNVVRLISPDTLGNVVQFEQEYVKSYNLFSNKPQTWKNLDKLGYRTAHLTYQIDKNDPEIASQFPEVITHDIELDWHASDRKIYDLLHRKAVGIFAQQGMDSVLPLIMLMQLMCDLPSAINASAESYDAWEQEVRETGAYSAKKGSEYAALFASLVGVLRNDNHTKLDYLRELITEQYADSKILIFTTFSHLVLPALSKYLDQWSVPHVIYLGTNKAKQEAQDAFKADERIRVFLSSDAGSDSISLEEGQIVIHFDLPYSYATYTQRQNRCHRITSTNDHVKFITLLMEDSVEQRKKKIMDRKKSYQTQIFEGAQDQMTAQDLRWILTGG